MKILLGLFVIACVAQRLEAVEDPFVPVVIGDGDIPVDGCPLMRVYYGDGAGVYNYYRVNNVWKNKNSVLNLDINNIDFNVGPTSEYFEGNNTFEKTFDSGPDLAECVFSKNYCAQVDLRTNSDCYSGRWTKINNERWTMASQPGYYLKIGVDFELSGNRNWECYDTSGFRDSVRDSSKYFMATCVNDVFPEGVKYGYNHYTGDTNFNEKVFLVGEGSPDSMVYHEGSFFRMYQVTTPDTDAEIDMLVYPRYGQYYGDESVVVVTAFGSAPAVFAVITDLRHSFRLNNPHICTNRGGNRMNVLQIKPGVYVSGIEQIIAQYGITLENRKELDITFPSAFANTTSHSPVVIGQIYNPVGYSIAYHRIKNVTQTEMTVSMEGNLTPNTSTATIAGFGYVAIYSQYMQFASPLWGVNTLVEDWNIRFANTYIGPISYDYAEGTEVLLFSDLNSYSDAETVATLSISSHDFAQREFSVSIHDYDCSEPNRKLNNVVSVATFGFRRKGFIREAVPGIGTVGCPLLYGGGICLHGMYVAKNKFTEYKHSTSSSNTIKFEDGQAVCFKDGVEAGPVETACLLSGTYCTKVTILNRECQGTYDWAGPGLWANGSAEGGFSQITYKGQHNNGYMHLQCETLVGNEEVISYNMRYVCDNDYVLSGLDYGLNKIGDEYVYILGDHMMSVGWAYRLFTVTMPADGSPVWVYPMAHPWNRDSDRGYSIKAQVHVADKDVITFVSELDSVGNLGFKLEVVSGDCQPNGSEVVNIMQVRWGIHKRGDETLGAGYAQITDFCDRCQYWGAEGEYGYNFAWTPKIFVQVQEVLVGPTTHNFIFNEYTNASRKRFKVTINGLGQNNTWEVIVGWIGMMMDIRDTTVRRMLGALDYSSKSIYSDTDKVTWSSPDTRRPYTAVPFIFAEKFLNEWQLHYPVILPDSTQTSFGSVIRHYPCDEGTKDEVQNVGYDVTSIGENVEPVRLRVVDYGENQRGCPLMRGYGACNKLFYPDLDVMYTPDNSLTLFKRLDGLWECCETDSVDPSGPSCKSGGGVMEGERIADCLTSETFCTTLEVYDDEYGGWHSTKINPSTYQLYGGTNKLILTKTNDREPGAVIVDSEGEELAQLQASQLDCVRDNPIDTKYGRASYGDNKWAEFENYYLVKDQYVEGPGSSYSVHHGPDETSGVVWYKYFQVELTEADASVPLYVHVPGAHFLDAVAVATAYNTSRAPMAILFDGVSSNGLRIQSRLPECQGSFVSEKVNVLIAQSGEWTTHDTKARFEVFTQSFSGNGGYAYGYDGGNPPVLLSDIQQTTVSGVFISTRTSHITNQVTVSLEVETNYSIPNGAVTSVGIIVAQFKNYLGTAETGRDRIFGHHAQATDPLMTSAPRTFDLDQYARFESAPFIIAKVASVYGAEPCEMRIVNATSEYMTIQIVEGNCSSTHHSGEEWDVLMFGQSARFYDSP